MQGLNHECSRRHSWGYAEDLQRSRPPESEIRAPRGNRSAAPQGDDGAATKALADIFMVFNRRIALMVYPPFEKLDRLALQLERFFDSPAWPPSDRAFFICQG